MSEENFERTSLYRRAFIEPRTDCTLEEQRFFQENFRAMRARVIPVVARIQRDMPDYTVHDITHLDALWEMGSLLLTKEGDITPAEAFVFGGAVLLHDAGMTLAAYPGGLPEIEGTIEWQDTIACLAQEQSKLTQTEITRQAIPIVLRQLHAKAAESLALNSWKDEHGTEQHLIETSELRSFYGRTIGLIAYSHWWPVHKVGEQFGNPLGAYPKDCSTTVDRLKVACLLRLSDALHIDRRRAPPFLRTLLKPEGASANHWTAQEKIAKPRLEGDEIVFSSADAFPRSESSAWWLLFDMIAGIDKELRDVDALLQETAQPRFSASRVRGASSPQSLATIIETDEWKPVDTQLRVSDVPKVIEALGGAKLYGGNPTVALREMLQNSSDAINARRKLEHRPADWGQVTVSLQEHRGQWRLIVEDTGVGMSEQVLTGPLLDFGKSFWKSGLVTEEFPGLMKSGMHATGQFGIGFFSAFMLGKHIKVTSRKYTRGRDSARTLEFINGTSARPLLYTAENPPVDGGTRVEITLDIAPREKGGLLYRDEYWPPFSLIDLLRFLAPAFEVTLIAWDAGKSEIASLANDWLTIDDKQLLSRISGSSSDPNRKKTHEIPVLRGADGTVYGRARISGRRYRADACITVGGLRSAEAFNFDGILAGKPLTAVRDSAAPSIPKGILKGWVTQQALDIAKRDIKEQTKANCAEVILQCGGNPSDLPIARLGERWLNIEAVRTLAARKTKIIVHNDDEPTFEDTDDVRPSEFEDNLVLKPSVLFVPKHFGGLSHSSNSNERYDYPKPTHNLSILVHLIIKNAWKTVLREVKTLAIGEVLGTAITRPVTIYRRQNTTK